jgi:hypothetical protein
VRLLGVVHNADRKGVNESNQYRSGLAEKAPDPSKGSGTRDDPKLPGLLINGRADVDSATEWEWKSRRRGQLSRSSVIVAAGRAFRDTA